MATLMPSLKFTLKGLYHDQTALVPTSTHDLGHRFRQNHDSLSTLLIKHNPTCSLDDFFDLGQLDVRGKRDDAVLFDNIGLGEERTEETGLDFDRGRFWVVSVGMGEIMRSSESSEEPENSMLCGSVEGLGGVLQGRHRTDQKERVVSRRFLRERSVCGIFLSKGPVSQMSGVDDSGQVDINGLHVRLFQLCKAGAATSVSYDRDDRESILTHQGWVRVRTSENRFPRFRRWRQQHRCVYQGIAR